MTLWAPPRVLSTPCPRCGGWRLPRRFNALAPRGFSLHRACCCTKFYDLTPCCCNSGDPIKTATDLSAHVGAAVKVNGLCYSVSEAADGSGTLTPVTVEGTAANCGACCPAISYTKLSSSNCCFKSDSQAFANGAGDGSVALVDWTITESSGGSSCYCNDALTGSVEMPREIRGGAGTRATWIMLEYLASCAGGGNWLEPFVQFDGSAQRWSFGIAHAGGTVYSWGNFVGNCCGFSGTNLGATTCQGSGSYTLASLSIEILHLCACKPTATNNCTQAPQGCDGICLASP